MSVLETIKTRRAIQHYDPDFVMPQQDVDLLLEHMLHAPTSFNIQHWRFVLIENKELRRTIRDAAMDQVQFTDASLLIIVCADLKAWNKNPQRYWKDAPEQARNAIVPLIKPFYDGKEQLQRDEALRSVGIAAQTTMLAAKSMGYDSCPMIGFDSEKVADLINLPDDHIIGMMVAVGKASRPARPKPGQLPLNDVVVRNRFS